MNKELKQKKTLIIFQLSTNEGRETFGTVEYTREGSTSIFYTECKKRCLNIC